MRTVQVTISGRVEGIGFRDELRDQAEAVHVDGWCRNSRDGDVVAVLAGSEWGVDRVVAWCRKGPGWARIDNVVVRPSSELVEHGFQII